MSDETLATSDAHAKPEFLNPSPIPPVSPLAAALDAPLVNYAVPDIQALKNADQTTGNVAVVYSDFQGRSVLAGQFASESQAAPFVKFRRSDRVYVRGPRGWRRTML